jgi:hypothetical protein
MARIVGGIGISHVPAIGMAFDKGSRAIPTGSRCSKATSRWRNRSPKEDSSLDLAEAMANVRLSGV